MEIPRIPAPLPLAPERLRRRTHPSDTRPVVASAPLGFLGQARARDAVELAGAIRADGFNLFVAADPGADAASAVRRLLESVAADRDRPSDWVYVSDFNTPHRPRALQLPPGRALIFRTAIRDLVIDLSQALPAAFEKPDFQARRRGIEDSFKERQEDAFEALGNEGRKRHVAIIRTPMGFSLGPLQDGEVIEPKAFIALPEAEREHRQAQMKEMQGLLEETLRELPKWERDVREKVRALERETAEAAIRQSIEEAQRALQDLPPALEHLDAMREDLIENVIFFANVAAQASAVGFALPDRDGSLGPFDRYEVNVFISQDCPPGVPSCGAPVIEEPHPTLANMVGRVEHRAEEGVLKTSFMLIKPGALHRANGGFLIVDARSLLREPLAWDALKRALRQGVVKIESVGQALNLSSTITLDPQPIPIALRLVLVGDSWIYHVLAAYDPEFETHFKLLADFETETPRSRESEQAYAGWLTAMAGEQGLLPPDTGALERLVEEAARAAHDSEKLTLVSSEIRDLLVEASHLAAVAARSALTRDDVDHAVEARRRRHSRMSDLMQESIVRDIALIDTDGARVGQINGLSVFQIGSHRFGKPTRITARTRPGAGRVVDIEREARLGGPIHTKGVMILTGFLVGRYAQALPMSACEPCL